MKKIIELFIIVVTLFSCSDSLNWGDSTYFKFTNENYEYIPTVYDDIGKIIKFKNQYDEEVKIEILDYRISQEKSDWVSSEPYHYYQLLTIELSVLDEGLTNSSCDLKTILISNWAGHYFITRFYFSNAPDPCNYNSSLERMEYPYQVNEMIVNSKTYSKVVTLFDGGTIYFIEDYSFDKVYFDFKEGIIGFDNTANDIQYRIVNN